MRPLSAFLLLAGLILTAATTDGQPPPESGRANTSVADMAKRLMAFDANKDGKLTKEELGDPRLHPLFDRADADKDGFVTEAELTALLTKESANDTGGRGGPGGGGPGGPPPGGRSTPGQVLPAAAQAQLQLTDAQKAKLAEIQKAVDVKLATILTAEQQAQLQDLKARGPGGPPPR